jgi:hypothetical protein
MANPEHLKILKQGVEVWNRWRIKNPSIKPDLSEADISLRRWDKWDTMNLLKGSFSEWSLLRNELNRVDFSNTNLEGTNIMWAYLSNSNFYRANLTGACLQDAFLINANFIEANLSNTDFEYANLSSTIFAYTDLSTCSGLSTIHVSGPCIIDFHTLRASRNLPKSFLLKIGLPENYINYLPDFFDENPIRMYPVFLSHSWQNKDFANKLYEALIARGVQVWYDEKKMKPGDDIYESLSRGIEVYDKMILVCSRQSLAESWWVDREIDRILAKERQLHKERGKRINLLIPIRIDDHIFEWDGAKGEEVRRYAVGDFRDWQDETKFQKALDELIAALNVDRGKDAPPSFL